MKTKDLQTVIPLLGDAIRQGMLYYSTRLQFDCCHKETRTQDKREQNQEMTNNFKTNHSLRARFPTKFMGQWQTVCITWNQKNLHEIHRKTIKESTPKF